MEAREALLTHDYVLLESVALVQARLGLRELERSKQRHVSLVDHISFLVMQRRQVKTVFAFDPDFTAAGFRLFEA
jgi:predicted nucleic acid-binding protein